MSQNEPSLLPGQGHDFYDPAFQYETGDNMDFPEVDQKHDPLNETVPISSQGSSTLSGLGRYSSRIEDFNSDLMIPMPNLTKNNSSGLKIDHVYVDEHAMAHVGLGFSNSLGWEIKSNNNSLDHTTTTCGIGMAQDYSPGYPSQTLTLTQRANNSGNLFASQSIIPPSQRATTYPTQNIDPNTPMLFDSQYSIAHTIAHTNNKAPYPHLMSRNSSSLVQSNCNLGAPMNPPVSHQLLEQSSLGEFKNVNCLSTPNSIIYNDGAAGPDITTAKPSRRRQPLAVLAQSGETNTSDSGKTKRRRKAKVAAPKITSPKRPAKRQIKTPDPDPAALGVFVDTNPPTGIILKQEDVQVKAEVPTNEIDVAEVDKQFAQMYERRFQRTSLPKDLYNEFKVTKEDVLDKIYTQIKRFKLYKQREALDLARAKWLCAEKPAVLVTKKMLEDPKEIDKINCDSFPELASLEQFYLFEKELWSPIQLRFFRAEFLDDIYPDKSDLRRLVLQEGRTCYSNRFSLYKSKVKQHELAHSNSNATPKKRNKKKKKRAATQAESRRCCGKDASESDRPTKKAKLN